MKDTGRFPEESHRSASDDRARETALERLANVAREIKVSRSDIIERSQALIRTHLEEPEIAQQLAAETVQFTQFKDAGKGKRTRKPDLCWLDGFTKSAEGAPEKAIRSEKQIFGLVLPFLAKAAVELDGRPEKLAEADIVSHLKYGSLLHGAASAPSNTAVASTFPFVPVFAGNPDRNDFDGFFNAEPQGLNAIAAGCDIARSPYTKGEPGLKERLFGGEHLACEVVVLSGPSGAGKSILLDRIAHDALERSWRVFRCRGAFLSDEAPFFHRLDEIARGAQDVLIVIDGADEAVRNGFSLKALTQFESADAKTSITVVMAMNSGLLSADLRSTFPVGPNFATYHIGELDDGELLDLVQGIMRAEAAGQIKNRRTTLTEGERLERLKSRKDRMALIALLILRYGQAVREVIREEYAPLPDETKRMLRRCALLEKLGLAMPAAQIQFHDEANSARAGFRQLTRLDGGYCLVRHPRLVTPTLDVALPEPEDRSDELVATLRALNSSGHPSAAVLIEIFTLATSGRRIMSLFRHDRATVATFVDQMEALAEEFLRGDYGWLLLSFLGQISKDALGDYAKSASLFERACAANPGSAFVRRQLAWSYHKLGDTDALTKTALTALEDFPSGLQLRSDCAHVLAMTVTKENLAVAREVIDELVRENPADRQLRRRSERIEQLARVTSAIDADEIPDWAAKELPLDRLAWRARRNGERYYKQNLFNDLCRDLAEMNCDLELIKEAEGLEVAHADLKLRALLLAHSGRYLYQRWYIDEEDVDLDHVAALLQEAIQLWPGEPFAHCWLGTLLKEVKRDYAGAMSEYSRARQEAARSGLPHLAEHPLILNNIALLKMDMVRDGLLTAHDGLNEAAALLKIAFDGLTHHPRFSWPFQTRLELEQLCMLKGVPFPFELFPESRTRSDAKRLF